MLPGAGWSRVRARSPQGPALRAPSQRIHRASSCLHGGQHSRRHLIAMGVMMQRGDGEGSCSGCERFVSISQGKKTTGLAEELDWFLLSPSLFSSPPESCSVPWSCGSCGRAGAWHSPQAAFSCYGSVTIQPFLDPCQVPLGLLSLTGVMERLMGC